MWSNFHKIDKKFLPQAHSATAFHFFTSNRGLLPVPEAPAALSFRRAGGGDSSSTSIAAIVSFDRFIFADLIKKKGQKISIDFTSSTNKFNFQTSNETKKRKRQKNQHPSRKKQEKLSRISKTFLRKTTNKRKGCLTRFNSETSFILFFLCLTK